MPYSAWQGTTRPEAPGGWVSTVYTVKSPICVQRLSDSASACLRAGNGRHGGRTISLTGLFGGRHRQYKIIDTITLDSAPNLAPRAINLHQLRVRRSNQATEHNGRASATPSPWDLGALGEPALDEMNLRQRAVAFASPTPRLPELWVFSTVSAERD
jgi:hypothetical protein